MTTGKQPKESFPNCSYTMLFTGLDCTSRFIQCEGLRKKKFKKILYAAKVRHGDKKPVQDQSPVGNEFPAEVCRQRKTRAERPGCYRRLFSGRISGENYTSPIRLEVGIKRGTLE